MARVSAWERRDLCKIFWPTRCDFRDISSLILCYMECTHVGQAVKLSSQLIQKIRREKAAQWTCSSRILVERAKSCPLLNFGLLVSPLPVLLTFLKSWLNFSALACRSTKSPWICLRCGSINCGRYIAKWVPYFFEFVVLGGVET